MTLPRCLGRYEIDATLREEPLGEVLRGRLPVLNRSVWIGLLRPPPALSAEMRARLIDAFEAECRRLVEVGDPRVQPPCDLSRASDGAPFVVFDRPEAAGYEPLPDRGTLSAEEWARVAAALGEILQALQDAEIPVETLHPANIFRSEEGALRYLPLHFGHLARTARLGSYPPAPGTIAAPELAVGGQPSSASLVYAVGAWLYGRITGLAAEELAARVLAGQAPAPVRAHNTAVRDQLCDALEVALSARPEERFPTLRAFSAALRLDETSAAPPAAAKRAAPAPDPPDRLLVAGWWITGAVLVTLLGLMCGWAMAQVAPLR